MSIKHIVPVLAAAVLAGCGPSTGQEKGGKGGHPGMGGGMPAAEVTAVTVEPKSFPVAYEYVGQTAGSREVEVRARVTGILLKRNFKEGGRVEKGQSLYTIDPAPFQAALVLSVPKRLPTDETQETLRTSMFPSSHVKARRCWPPLPGLRSSRPLAAVLLVCGRTCWLLR